MTRLLRQGAAACEMLRLLAVQYELPGSRFFHALKRVRVARSPQVDPRYELALNGRFLSQRTTGVQRYAQETLAALDVLLAESVLDHPISVTLFVPPGAKAPRLRSIRVQEIGRVQGNAWEQLELPRAVGRRLLLSFSATGPVLKRRQIVTIHDAAVHSVPGAFSRAFRTWYKALLPVLARRGPAVMTVSEFSKREITRCFGAEPERVHVSGEGWEHITRAGSDDGVLAAHGLTPQRYVLVVGSVTPHKNFDVVARALRKLPHRSFDVAVAGALNARVFGDVDTRALGDLKLLGYVSDEALRSLYGNAAAFVFPSLYEGFGIPPLEAMALGCPVIASNAAAIPETCGPAALYFEPGDADALAELLVRVTDDAALRDELRARAAEQLRRHGWRRTAARHLARVASVQGWPRSAALEALANQHEPSQARG